MVSKLLSILSTAKGASAAAVLAAAATTGTVMVTNEDARDTANTVVQNVVATVTGTQSDKDKDEDKDASCKPAVVAARNDADKKIREAFQSDQRALERLRSTKVDDHRKLEDLVKDADGKLHDRYQRALDQVGALTLGRGGRQSATPGASPTASPTASPSASTSVSAAAAESPCPSPKTATTFSAQSQVDAIVTAAIADMKKIVDDATKAVAALPTNAPGKPENPGNKPSENPGKSVEQKTGESPKADEHGKPTSVPPSPRPTPTR